MGYKTGRDKVENRLETLSTQHLRQLKEHLTNIRDRTLVFLGFETAARVREMEKFTVAGIHWESGVITKYDVKKKRWIEVGISPELLKDLRLYIDSFKIRGELFIIHWKRYNEILQDACKEIGITQHVSWHLLRRSFCSQAEDHGYTMKEVMHITGDTERTVAKYYHRVSVADLGKKASRFYQP